jgi:NAD(P)H dehydrogenase (quinone)
MLLITGANGQLGRLIVEDVLRRAPDLKFAVSVRDPAGAGDLAKQGVEVRHGDYDRRETLTTVFAGVDKLLLMPTPAPDPGARADQARRVVRAAAEAGVKHVIYPGAHAADQYDAPLFKAHLAAEDAVRESGMTLTALRNAIYADVVAPEVQGAVLAGELAAPAGDARIAPVLRQDLAAATATVLLEDGHQNTTYELTGPDTIGWDDLAKLATEQAGKPIAYRAIDDAEAAARLSAAGLPEPIVGVMLGFYAAYRAGWCATPTSDLERLSGRATPSLDAIRGVLAGSAK